jgi:phosphohistidine phosphatase SixA
MTMLIGRRRALCLGLGVLIAPGVEAAQPDSEAALWESLARGEAVAVMRHALAPGTGDPGNFRIGDCATQRNLSGEGRAQARAIGDRFRANGIERAEVQSSQWCRCLETAELLGLGPVAPLPALNSFFRDRQKGPAQTKALRRHLRDRTGERPLVLVTHQVNITALTGVYPSSGEVIVIRGEDDDSSQVLGTIETSPA